ncbi:CDP-glycerol glycerophosphotransferase family protein [Arthrobacter sp. G119Y2]|uniref:CDP-glycerol glycerophosphotransferase family protein n=1 Tax=Arthrobacter sp. G119Y2 TaxID=3134965 RepID=UPI0031195CF3
MTAVDRTAEVWTAPEVESVPLPASDSAAVRRWLDDVFVAAAVMRSEAPTAEAQQWYGRRLADLLSHVEYIQHSDQDRFDVLRNGVSAMLAAAGPGVLQTMDVHQRVLLSLTRDGRRGDVLLVLTELQDEGRSYLTAPTPDLTAAGALTAVPGYLPLLSEPVEPSLLNLSAVDLPVTARLTRFVWAADGLLTIGGWAYLPGVDPADCVLEVGLRPQGSSVVTALAVRREQDQRVDAVAADRCRSYSGAAFTASVDPRTLQGLQPGGAKEWAVQVTLRVGAFSASDLIRTRDTDLVPRRLPVAGTASDRTRVIGVMDAADGLRLKAVRYSCLASSLKVAGQTVRVGFGESGGVVPDALYLDSPGGPRLEFRRETGGTRFTIDTASAAGELPAGAREKRWTVQALLPNGRVEPAGWAGSGTDLAAASEQTAALRAECTGYGYLQLSLRAQRLSVSRAELIDEAGLLVLEGRLGWIPGRPDPEVPELLLTTARNEVRSSSSRWLDETGRFRTEFSLVQNKWGHGESALETGHYRILRAWTDATGEVRTARVQALGRLLGELPARMPHKLMGLELVGEGNEQDLVLRVSAPGTADQRSARGRQLAIAGYTASEAPVDPETVLFETFDGKSCSDSGRAISDALGDRRPDLHRFWAVADYSVQVPPNCTPVLRESPEWFRLLATAGYLVNNNNFPHYFRKRPGQFYLQTWHGTPLKRIGLDTPVSGSTASYRALIQREAAAWDMLLAQNEFAAETLAAAFGYQGEPAVFGYPRNDVLTTDASSRRAESRGRLGIAADRKVLLYMPTWRDNGAGADPYLDFEAAAEQLGPEYALLYRGHHKIAGRRKTTGQDLYLDVTTHPEVNDLYLAADLLVTDYSSAMFDFSVTGKPIYFLTPDLARYRDSERGFYFDFEAQAPGPLASDTDGLAASVLAAEAEKEPYVSRYREFVCRYAPLEDGIAAHRVAGAIWMKQH